MKSIILWICFIGCLTCLTCRSASLPTKVSIGKSPTPDERQLRNEPRAQTRFGAEETIERPVDLPHEILQILRRDEHNQSRLGNGRSVNEITATWFAASEIDLDGDESPDLIVQAVEPRLLGANLVPFWIFRSATNGYKLLLRVDTLSLELLNEKTRGLRNLVSRQATAGEIRTGTFVFDGRKYRERKSSTEKIKPE
jgi:hypothetical protein